jgi:hypothetical protein
LELNRRQFWFFLMFGFSGLSADRQERIGSFVGELRTRDG